MRPWKHSDEVFPKPPTVFWFCAPPFSGEILVSETRPTGCGISWHVWYGVLSYHPCDTGIGFAASITPRQPQREGESPGEPNLETYVYVTDKYSSILGLTPLEPQSRFRDKLLEIWVVCSQNGTAVLKGLTNAVTTDTISLELKRGRLSATAKTTRFTEDTHHLNGQTYEA